VSNFPPNFGPFLRGYKIRLPPSIRPTTFSPPSSPSHLNSGGFQAVRHVPRFSSPPQDLASSLIVFIRCRMKYDALSFGYIPQVFFISFTWRKESQVVPLSFFWSPPPPFFRWLFFFELAGLNLGISSSENTGSYYSVSQIPQIFSLAGEGVVTCSPNDRLGLRCLSVCTRVSRLSPPQTFFRSHQARVPFPF